VFSAVIAAVQVSDTGASALVFVWASWAWEGVPATKNAANRQSAMRRAQGWLPILPVITAPTQSQANLG
jgi:hypothetical protein